MKLEERVVKQWGQNSVSIISEIIRINVVSWNISVKEYSQVMYLDHSKFDEISNDGCIQMLLEMLHDYVINHEVV